MAARGRRPREGCGEQRKVQAARGSQQEAQVWPLYGEEPEAQGRPYLGRWRWPAQGNCLYLSGIQRSQLGVCAFQTTHSCISLLIQGGPSPTRSQTLEGTVSRTTRPACLWAAPQAQYVGPQGLSRTKTGRAPSSHGTGVRGPHVRPTHKMPALPS